MDEPILYKDLQDLGYTESYEYTSEFNEIIKQIISKDDTKRNEQIYAALCDVIWFKGSEKKMVSYSWRSAGQIIAKLQEIEKIGIMENLSDIKESKNDNTEFINMSYYLDYYCTGNEGFIEDWIYDHFTNNDWYPAYYTDSE